MSDDSDVNVKFGATITDLLDKVGEVQGVFKDLVEQFAGVAAVFAGGAAFKEFLDSAVDINNETVKLAKTLGVAGDEAAALKTGIEDVGGSVETYAGAFTKFSRQLANNGDTLKQYGIDVAGVRNGTISGTDAFNQALKIVSSYKSGIDQNEASMKFFGRSIGDVQTLLKLTPAIIEEARKKNEELNLNISTESVEAARKYTLAMHDVGDVLTGVKKTIGEALLPIFTEASEKLASFGPDIVEGTKAAIGTFIDIYTEMRDIVGEVFDDIKAGVHDFLSIFTDAFGTEAPSAMQVFKNALAIVHAAFTAFGIGFHEIQNSVKTGIDLLANGFSTFAAVAERALHLDFAGAQAEFKAGIDRSTEIVQAGIDKQLQIAEKGAADLAKILGLDGSGPAAPKASTPYTPPGGTKNFTPINKDADAQNSARKALLKAQTEAELAIVKEVLSEQQAALDDAFKQGLESTKEYYAQTLAITLAGLDAELAARQKELADAQAAEKAATKPQDKLKFQAQEAAIEGQINVLESQRTEAIVKNANAYRDAERERLDALAAFAAAQQKAGSDDQVAKEKAALDQEKALRQISADEAFAIEQRLEDESYAALVQSLQSKMSLIRGSEDEQAKQRQAVQLEIEAAERDHQNKLTSISNAAEQDREKYSVQMQQQTQSAFATLVGTYLQGVTSMGDAIRQFAVTVGNNFANLIGQKFTDKLFDVTGVNQAIDKMVGFVTSGISKMVTQWIGGEAAQTAAATSGAATRGGVKSGEAAAAVAQKATETTAAVTAEGTQTAASTAGDATRTATGETATATAIASQQAASVAAVLGYAAEAAVAAMASVAAIPFVGWAMAPEVGAATYATGLAYLASAAGGWDRVPEDQLAQVHKDEMVMSAPLAAGIRNLVSSGKQGNTLPTNLPIGVSNVGQISAAARPNAAQVQAAKQSMAAPASVTFSVQAMDSQDVQAFFNKHGRKIATTLQGQARNFVGLKAAT